MPLDMGKYGDSYLRVDDLNEMGGTLRATIEAVEDGAFDKPVLVLSDGSTVSLNDTSLRRLRKAWGRNADDYIGEEVELTVHPFEIKRKVSNGNGGFNIEEETKGGILVSPLSPPIPLAERTPFPAPPGPKPLDDSEIPF